MGEKKFLQAKADVPLNSYAALKSYKITSDALILRGRFKTAIQQVSLMQSR
jgi:hypothetical protein